MEKGKCLDFIGYGKYAVSNLGNVKKISTEKLIKYRLKCGYYLVDLYDNNIKRRCFLVHRLVAMAFVPNNENKPEIDHIDTCRTNNVATNLRGVTRKENMNNPITLPKLKQSEETIQKRRSSMIGKHGTWKKRKKEDD